MQDSGRRLQGRRIYPNLFGSLLLCISFFSLLLPLVKFQGNYSAQADLWSVGVITYMLLCSRRPFHHRKREVTIDKIMRGDYGRLEGGPWRNISEEAKDFVRKLLVVDPKERMTATEALAHPWLEEDFHARKKTKGDETERETQLAVGESLQNYKNELELKKIALNVRKKSKLVLELARERSMHLLLSGGVYLDCLVHFYPFL